MRQKSKGTKNDSLCLYFCRSGEFEKVIYNQITRFFSREYRVSLPIIDTSWQTFESAHNDELLTYQADPDQHCQGRGLSS